MPAHILADELLDAQLLRVMGSAPYGGADVDECRAIASRLVGTDLDGWFDAWTDGADRATALAEAALERGDVDAARGALFRASNYHRNAGVMLLGTPVDPRLVASHTRQTEAFRRAAALLERPPELVEIPFEGASLPAYFFRAAGAGPRATVILTGGYDGTAEELYFFNGVAALARGYHVLAFDGPGQGAALLDRGLPMRPDWETVIAPVVDHLRRPAGGGPGADRPHRPEPRRASWRHARPARSIGWRRASPTAGPSTCTRPSWNGCPVRSPARSTAGTGSRR